MSQQRSPDNKTAPSGAKRVWLRSHDYRYVVVSKWEPLDDRWVVGTDYWKHEEDEDRWFVEEYADGQWVALRSVLMEARAGSPQYLTAVGDDELGFSGTRASWQLVSADDGRGCALQLRPGVYLSAKRRDYSSLSIASRIGDSERFFIEEHPSTQFYGRPAFNTYPNLLPVKQESSTLPWVIKQLENPNEKTNERWILERHGNQVAIRSMLAEQVEKKKMYLTSKRFSDVGLSENCELWTPHVDGGFWYLQCDRTDTHGTWLWMGALRKELSLSGGPDYRWGGFKFAQLPYSWWNGLKSNEEVRSKL